VPTARSVGLSSGRIRRRACGLPYPASSRQLRPPPVAFPACVSTRVPQRRCLPFHAPIPPATSTDCSAASDGGQVVILRPVVRGLMAVVLPQSRFPVPSPGRFGCPAGDPTPIMQVKVRTRAKSRVSIGIATLIQGMRFHGN